MIIINGKQITAIHAGGKAVQMVYKGARLVWQAVTSCCGAGWWRNDHVWKNDDCWKND